MGSTSKEFCLVLIKSIQFVSQSCVFPGDDQLKVGCEEV